MHSLGSSEKCEEKNDKKASAIGHAKVGLIPALSETWKMWGNDTFENVGRLAKPHRTWKKIMTPTRFELVPPKRPGIYGKVTLPWRLRPLGQSANYMVARVKTKYVLLLTALISRCVLQVICC